MTPPWTRWTLAVLLACGGCNFARWHWLPNESADRVVRVESGDRYFFKIEEPEGCRWMAASDDPDVEVQVDHDEGRAKVGIRIHRGYDGPSTVTFRCKRNGVKEPVRQFAVTFYREIADRAFWE